jgi:ornithine cyclodeaminase/alanine dehydrogenase-like protein (mu-crystallin family)
MLIITRDELRRAAPIDRAIEGVTSAFAQLSSGQADVPLRTHIAIPPEQGLELVMPAYLANTGALGVKALTLFPHNAARSLPTINALVLLFDAANGLPLALFDGGYLTALRTGAASGAATRLMARDDARVMALFGAGTQALPQVWAVCVARPIERVWIVNRSRERAEALRLALLGQAIQAEVRLAESAAAALAEADVICCATRSPTPLFADADVQPGTHINGVGSYTPELAEVPPETVARAYVVVDQRAAAWAEAGDLIQARRAGLLDESQVVELGQVIAGQAAARTDEAQITFFKSVGNAVQDLAVGQLALAEARRLGLGVEVAL